MIKLVVFDLRLFKVLDYKYVNKVKNVVILVIGIVERLYLRFVRIMDNNDVYLKF